MKVVHYNSSFCAITENWIYNQVEGLGDNVATVYAIDRRNADRFPFRNLRCLREDLGYFPLLVNRAWEKLFHRHPQLLLWLWKDRPDLIHAHFGPGGCDIVPYAKWLDIPLITSFYGYDAYLLPQKEPRWRDNYKRLFERGRLFLAEGSAMRHRLADLGCPSEKLVVHHVGVKLEKYELCPRQPGNEIRLMVCGRFTEKKGIPYAIEALKRVMVKTKATVRLTIVGDSNSEGTMTEEKRNILDTIARHAVGNAVTITGYIPPDELMKLVYSHHILLVPSVHASDGDAEGGFPVILTEALATGMPVVAFDHCDIPEIVQHGKSGFLVPERDVDGLSERLLYLIAHPEVWPKMGYAGRAHVEANYNIRKLNSRLLEIYEQSLQA